MSLLRSYLEDNGILSASDLDAAARHQQAQGGSLDTALLELGLLAAGDLDTHLGRACGLPTAPARLLETGPTRPWGQVPKAMLDIGWVLPLALEDGLLLVAVHPDLPDARLGALYRQIRGFTPMVTPECCLAKLNAERLGNIVAPRHAMLVLDVLDALHAREADDTTLVGHPTTSAPTTSAPTSAPTSSPTTTSATTTSPTAPSPVDSTTNAPTAPIHAAFTIPYAAAGPQIAVHAAQARHAADSQSATVAEPVYTDGSLVDAAAESLTAAATVSQPIPPTHDPASAGVFPVPRTESDAFASAGSGTFPGEPAKPDTLRPGPTPVPQDSRAPTAPVSQDSRVPAAVTARAAQAARAPTAPVSQDSRPSAQPVPQDSRPSAQPVPQDSRPSAQPVPQDSRPSALPVSSDTQPTAPRPPAGTTTAPAAQDSRPADPSPSPSPRIHPRSGGVSNTRNAPLPQLPLAQRLAPARAALAQARERDRITESLVRAAIQVAPRVALFGVKREGLRALAAPGSSLHLPRSLVIPIPDGSLLDRAVSGEIRLRLLTEPQLAFAVGRPLGIPCILEPVYAQSRCVLMLYIDRSGSPFEASEQAAVRDLCEVARSSLEALLRIMGLGQSQTNMRQADLVELTPTPTEPTSDAATPDPTAYVAAPATPDPAAYIAPPEPAAAPTAWLTRAEPGETKPDPDPPTESADPEPIASSKPSPSAWLNGSEVTPARTTDPADTTEPAESAAPTTDTTKPAESVAPTADASEPAAPPARSPDMDGVPELTRRPRRAVIALVNPIRREPTPTEPTEPTRSPWLAAREQYAETPADETAPADTEAVAAPAPSDNHEATADTTPAPVPQDSYDEPAPSDSHITRGDAPVSSDSPTSPVPEDSHDTPIDAPVPEDSHDTPIDAPVPSDSHATLQPAPARTPSPALDIRLVHVPTDARPATAEPAPAPSDSSVAPVDTTQADADPSASSSGLHMPNLVAPGVRRNSGKRGDRTRPVEPAVVIPYDLRRPEHRTAPAKPGKPAPSVQIPASLIAPAPLPGSTRRGKSPQHPTPPRAEDVTLNMPMLVRSPTSLPPEPTSLEPSSPAPDSTPLAEPTATHEPAPTEAAPSESAETPTEARADAAPEPTPSEPTAVTAQPAPTPSEPTAVTAQPEPPSDVTTSDLSEQPATTEPATEPTTLPDPDAALAAYLQHSDDPATLAALLALGDAVYPPIAARFPGPIDPRSATDVRSFPPPSLHGPLLRACVEIGEPLTPHILELLEHQRPQIRFYAAFLFQELRDVRSLRPLAAHAFDPDPDVRLIATRVLESYNRTDGFAAATEQVRAALTGRDRDRALLATEATGTLRDTRAVPILIDLLSVRDKQIRETALEALCSITAKHHGYRPAKWRSWYADHGEQPRVLWVMDALKHRDPAVRRWAADELTRVTGHRIPPPSEGEKITPRYVLQTWEAWWDAHGAAFR